MGKQLRDRRNWEIHGIKSKRTLKKAGWGAHLRVKLCKGSLANTGNRLVQARTTLGESLSEYWALTTISVK